MALIAPNFDEIKDSTKSLVAEMVDSAENWAGVTTSTLGSIASVISDYGTPATFTPVTWWDNYDVSIGVSNVTCAEPEDIVTSSEVTPVTISPANRPESPDISFETPTVDFNELGIIDIPDLPTGPNLPTLSATTSLEISAPGVSTPGIAASGPETPNLPSTPGELAAPGFGSVEFPALILPTIPALEVISVPGELVALYDYDEPAYISKVSNEVQQVLQHVLAGNLITPILVWNGIWDRTVGDIERAFVGEEWAASELAASLGMTGLPSETLLSRWGVITNKKEQAISKARLEQAISEAQQRREDLWQATKDGIAFETMWLRHHSELAGRALASALNAHQAKVAVYNANVAVYNARVQYASYAVAYGQLELQAAALPLQLLTAQLEALRIEVLQDDQSVKRWLAEWQGYSAQIGGVTSIFQSEVSKYSADVQKEKVVVDAAVAVGTLENQHNSNLVSAYTAQAGAEGARNQAQTALFNAEVGKYSAEAQASVGFANVAVAVSDLQLKQDATRVSKFSAEIQLLQAILQARVSAFQAEVTAMDAENKGEKAAADVDIAGQQLKLEAENQKITAFSASWRAISDQANACSNRLNAEINKAELSIKNETARIQNGIAGARLNLDSARAEAEVALQNARILLETSLNPIQSIATLQAGITQAYISAIDASMSISAQSQQQAQFDVGEDAGGNSSFG